MLHAQDHLFLLRCLELARLPGALAEPNPRVGAVVVHEGKIIGEGWHRRFGTGHAEVNAVADVADPALLPESTLYVSLEPCNHQGKTPPCTGLILRHRIPRVVIGSLDPSPKMQGKSVALLRAQGVEVTVNPAPAAFHALNAHFRLHTRLQRPFISLKWAESRDGFLAGLNADGNPVPTAISDPQVSRWVHFQRAQHQAILVGRRTVEIDDPGLTTRKWPGPNPVRVVVDPQLRLLRPGRSEKLFRDGRVILLNTERDDQEGQVEFFDISGMAMPEIMTKLYQRFKLGSLLVEGGAETHRRFLDAGLWDALWRNIGARNLGNGLTAPKLPADLQPEERLTWQADEVLHYQAHH